MKPPKKYNEMQEILTENEKKEQEYLQEVQDGRKQMLIEEADRLINDWNNRMKKRYGDDDGFLVSLITRTEFLNNYGY